MVKIDFVNAQEPAINDTNLNQMQLNIENAINAQVSGDTLPVGCIVPFTSDTVPENWLLCDGSAISRTEYDLLFSIIGTSYGVGDGSTTFNLPNLKGRVPTGKDTTDTDFDTLGKTGGEKTHTMTVNEMPSHNHGVSTNINCSSFGTNNALTRGAGGAIEWKDSSQYIGMSGGGQPFNVKDPFVVTNFIIKAKQTAGIVATVVDGLNSTSTTNALSANQGRNITTYSTTETRVGTWIDGKPIYRKVINFGNLPNSTNKKISHNIDNIETIINIGGYATEVGISTKNFYPLPLQYKGEDSDYNAEVVANNTYVTISASKDRSNYVAYVILEYTKTTD